MTASLVGKWRDGFLKEVQVRESASRLQQAALDDNLAAWTAALTAAVVAASGRLAWRASARSHKLDLLPVKRSEYLTLDVVAFAEMKKAWRFPVAVMELENQRRDDQIAYSLWKVICVRADLRLVFCYRQTSKDASALLRHLQDEVIEAMGLPGRLKLEGETVVVVGCREEAATFPYRFFKWWRLEHNTGKFEQLL